jgi:hypothetical protein
MKDGSPYVLNSWTFDEARKVIQGSGIYYSIDRSSSENRSSVEIDLDAVALLETNELKVSKAILPLTLMTGVSVALTAYCISNPKACFGSCPTFYVSYGNSLRLQAEGFTSSISPALEADDIDALYHARPSNNELTVEVKNEALETHVIRYVDVLAIPRKQNSRVFGTPDGRFFESDRILPPVSARAPEGDVLPWVLAADGKERFSLADEEYLGRREDVEFEFLVHPGKTYGLVIGRRQTLLPTFLFYQVLAYMGNEAGYWLARGTRREFDDIIKKFNVNFIDVSVYRDGQWETVGAVEVEGPLAVDFSLIELGRVESDRLRVRLRMTQGAVRLDYVALAEISKSVDPIVIHPYAVLQGKKEDSEALISLLGREKPLVMLPGDAYTLKYKLPRTSTNSEFELFIKTRGYYLEWIRKEWLQEENPLLVAEFIVAPERMLKRLAPKFKTLEPQMEEQFWRSKYAKP